MSKLFLIDPLNRGSSHAYINAAIARSFNDDTILIGNKSHIEAIKPLGAAFCYRSVDDSSLVLGIIKKFFVLLQNCTWKKSKILFLCLDNAVVPLLLILCYPLLFKTRLSIIIHNNMTTLTESKLKRNLHNWMTRLYNPQIFVLTGEMEGIYKSTVKNTVRCICLTHPNYKKIISVNAIAHIEDPSKINVVLLGRQAGFMIDYLRELSLDQIPKIHFTVVYSKPVEGLDSNEKITLIKKKLPFKSYYGLLKEADFCLFAPDESVKNRASGILMDCITVECPVIAPKFGHFLEYEGFGLGYLYERLEEINAILSCINDQDIRRNAFSSGFPAAAAYSSEEKLREIINKFV